jgi:oligopeptide transport system substrate-binding protein
MTTIKRPLRLHVAVLAGAVLLTGCGGAAGDEASAHEPVSIAIGDPVSPLVPGNTVEE